LDENVPISCTAARVPVYNGHSEAVDIEFEENITPEAVRAIMNNSYGIQLMDDTYDYIYPTARDASGKNPVYVGRIRKNLAFENGISLWCVADNLRIGAALNAVRIAKKVITMGLY
ncbi:MAG: Asd/ArgC dimerization domain-containing protein, partial [Oscillospiraceae bacterium]